MTKKRSWARPLIGVAGALGMLFLMAAVPYSRPLLSEDVRELLKRLSIWQQERPEDKVYVQMDRPFYEPGETVWFTAYVRDGATLKPSVVSDIVHVELIDPKGAVIQQHQLILNEGRADGDFSISSAMPGGMYKLKAYTEWMKNEDAPALFEKGFQVQSVVTPRVKMKLDFVREAYAAGATVEADITFESLTNDALRNREVQYILQVEGAAVMEGSGRTDADGKIRVAAELPLHLDSPDALLIVLMNHQGIMESISRSVPVVLEQIDISLFPEGGDLVDGLPSRVAFKALNAYGEPADIAGVVMNEAGEVVSEFESYHRGTGAFDITPEKGGRYHLALTEPYHTDPVFPLPEALPRGYTMNILSVTEEKAVVRIHSSESETLTLVGLVRGEAYYSSDIVINEGSQVVEVDLAEFPIGVAQFTLFDSRAIPRAERLAFVNQHRQMKVELETDKDKYLPREKVTLKVRTMDDRGMPLPAQLSLAVVDDRLRSFADDRSSNILSWLLVESDLEGKVDEPNFYVNPEEEKASLALDYLLMTEGWRRFTWREIAQQQLPPLTHAPQQTRVKGTIYDLNGLPVVGARIEGGGNTIVSNREGGFEFRNLDLFEPVDLHFSIRGREEDYIYRVGEYRDDLVITLGRKKGRIIDEAGEPLIGATVVVQGTTMGAFTDVNGEYEFPLANANNGPLNLVVSYVGYETRILSFSGPVEMMNTEEIVLNMSDVMLDEVVVMADRPTRIVQQTTAAVQALEGRVASVKQLGRRQNRRNRRAENAVPPPAPAQAMEVAEEDREMVLDDDFADMEELVPVPEEPPVVLVEMEKEVFDQIPARDADVVANQNERQFLGDKKRELEEEIAFQRVDRQPQAKNHAEVRRQMGYPQSARDAGIEGTVVARVLVNEQGQVIDQQIVKGAHPVLDKVVEQNLDDLSFEPALAGGDSMKFWVNLPFQFRLNGEMQQPRQIFLGSTAILSSLFYRARQFAAPRYGQKAIPKRRTDFRNTLHWEGGIETNRRGEATVTFYTSDALTSFHITAEGIGMEGSVGRAEHKLYSQLPFELDLRVPPLLTALDTVEIPLTLVNNTSGVVSGPLKMDLPKHLIPLSSLPAEISLQAEEAKTIMISCVVDTLLSEDSLSVRFRSYGFADEIAVPVRNASRGFPASKAFTSEETDSRFEIDLSKAVPGSVRMWLNAFPSVNGEIMNGLEGMLREPYGCFEQTSSSTYPNILALAYMEETDQVNPDISTRALSLIQRGYQRLMTFESPSGGFEWFGGDPGHEGLTAYGLMEFVDMARVYDGVDQKMIDRTVEWLLSRKDGNGGYLRNPRALHYFGLSDDATTSMYITYALTEAGYSNLDTEAAVAYEQAKESKRPYQLALAANLLLNLGQTGKGRELLELLVEQQLGTGTWAQDATQKSAPGSSGQALEIECTGLAILGMLKTTTYNRAVVEQAADWLRSQRSSYGNFGNTHSTVLALRALIEVAKHSHSPAESGEIAVYIDDELVASKDIHEDDDEAIFLEGLEAYLGNRVQQVRVVFNDMENALPYTLSVVYATDLPPSSEECVVSLHTEFMENSVNIGETLRMNISLKNRTEEGQPMTMLIIGLPAGMSAQPWQLKQLVERKEVDFYEISEQSLYLYYRQMAPAEEKNLALDLKAEVPGTFLAQASRAYLYYTDEHKVWQQSPEIMIRK